ncbi:MAG: hypothetical protein R2825_08240 [Saprospiraceae bacterium]
MLIIFCYWNTSNSKDEQIAAITINQLNTTHRFPVNGSNDWAMATDEKPRKMQAAVNYLYPYLNELI